MGVVQMSRGRMEARQRHAAFGADIVARLAEATLGPRSKVRWSWLAADYDRSPRSDRARWSRDLGLQPARAVAGRLLPPEWPREGTVTTATGKAEFTVQSASPHDMRKGEFLMMTVRSHDQYNTTL